MGIIIIQEISFFIGHKVFHHFKFLEKFHSIHHQYRKPSALTTFYFSKIDYLLNTMVPTYLGEKIVNFH